MIKKNKAPSTSSARAQREQSFDVGNYARVEVSFRGFRKWFVGKVMQVDFFKARGGRVGVHVFGVNRCNKMNR